MRDRVKDCSVAVGSITPHPRKTGALHLYSPTPLDYCIYTEGMRKGGEGQEIKRRAELAGSIRVDGSEFMCV
jgi:hypothetical protein